MMVPCLDCDELTDHGKRCEDCAAGDRRINRRTNPKVKKLTNAQQGYDSKWNYLSRKARRLQPFCSDCGTTENLTADHTPTAWRRKSAGLPIRLQDVDVVCIYCNIKRGAARGARSRSDGPNS